MYNSYLSNIWKEYFYLPKIVITYIYIRNICNKYICKSTLYRISILGINDLVGLLDDINLRIIDILSKDSSTTFVEIAKQIGISDATVHLRVRRLIAAGIITKFTISVNNNLLGYDHLAFMGINVEPGFADEATLELANLDEVLEIHEMHGTFDLLLKIRARDLNQMRDVVENKIRKLPHILETELMTVLKTKKEEQIVSLKEDILYKADGVIA
jgi:Lrp/AsnC family transcriptional regulator, regulator for asnA, asnC and gidA